jgi:hypothetical protein
MSLAYQNSYLDAVPAEPNLENLSVRLPLYRTVIRTSIAHPISTQGWAEHGGYGVCGVGGLEMLWAEGSA